MRHEYLLTDKGRAAWDVLAAMWRFGEDHLWETDEAPPVELAFRDTKAPVRPIVVDEATGRRVDLADVTIRRR